MNSVREELIRKGIITKAMPEPEPIEPLASKDLPAIECKGLVFWPIPVFTGDDVFIGARADRFFPRGDLPQVPSKYTDLASSLFFRGGAIVPHVGSDVNPRLATVALRSLLGSFEPAHEAKIATAGYLLWVLSPEAAACRKSES